MADVKVVSLGGSIIAPDGVDTEFVAEFRAAVEDYLGEDPERRLILVCGGGKICRDYQNAYRHIMREPVDQDADWIGVMTTRVNAELMKRVLAHHCPDPVVYDPTAVRVFAGRVMVASGWKPGFSTDYDAVVLAERFSSDTVVVLSNIEKVYTADPKADPGARPLDTVTWPEFLELIDDEWSPGLSGPLDPVAAKRAAELGLRCIFGAGRDIENSFRILRGESFTGTTIYPA